MLSCVFLFNKKAQWWKRIYFLTLLSNYIKSFLFSINYCSCRGLPACLQELSITYRVTRYPHSHYTVALTFHSNVICYSEIICLQYPSVNRLLLKEQQHYLMMSFLGPKEIKSTDVLPQNTKSKRLLALSCKVLHLFKSWLTMFTSESLYYT